MSYDDTNEQADYHCPPLRMSEIEYYDMLVGVHHYNEHVLSYNSFDRNRHHQEIDRYKIMDNAFVTSLQQQLQQANEEIQRLRASQVPSMPIPSPYPPQHLRSPLRPQFNTSIPLPHNQQNCVRPSVPQSPAGFTFGPFNNISQQIPIPGHIPTAASSIVHTTIPSSTGISSGFIPTIPCPRTGFQASPFVVEIALVDVPKKYSIPAFATKYSGITDPVEHVA
ncbi:hypothetical protein OSB04_002701 [Centaurea solstitialis]|uniref:Uncharacterized protein n=1 Tax=Centaurea solstitialis TaxID=347529 RepID=A0AA38WTC8_9ASTR|nr:hypothetical protein OSB04_002701 [Centaurea solstitialis]